MDVRLVIERGRTRTRVVRLTSPETYIGRQKGCGLRIPSADVSRRHCALRVANGYLTVQDLGSVNGTFVNGMRVVNQEVVRPGDHLEVGPVRFIVEYELTPDALDRLSQYSAPAFVDPIGGGEQVLDVLEVKEAAEEIPVLEVVEEIPALEVVEEEDPLVPADDMKLEVHSTGQDVGGGDADQWYIPPANELRDILAELDEPKTVPKKNR
jgi:pSer/pThr/pTyr-binding forkhead associated (FHA) protein